MTYTPRASLNLIRVVGYLWLAVLGWIAPFFSQVPIGRGSAPAIRKLRETAKNAVIVRASCVRWHNSRPGRKVPPGHDSGGRRSFNPVHNDRNRA